MFGIPGAGTAIGAGLGFWAGGPLGGAVGASIGAGLDAGEAQSEAIDKASKRQAQASAEAVAFQKWMYGENKAMLSPFIGAGRDILPDLSGRVKAGFTMGDFTADPGYAFRLGEGNKAIERAAGVGGSPYSGATLKALERYNTDLASSEYQTVYARQFNEWLNETGQMFNLANLGLSGAGALAGVGIQTGTNASNAAMSGANAQAAADIARGNVTAGLYNTIGNAPMNYLLLSKLAGGGAPGGSIPPSYSVPAGVPGGYTP